MTRAALTAMETALAGKARGLAPARAKAFEAFALTGMPHRRMEAWKWSDIRAALRDPLPHADNDVIAPSIFAGARPFEITVMNGVAEFRAPPAGVSIARTEAPLSRLAAEHPLANLCAAFAGENLEIEIRGAVPQPIHLRRIAGAGAVHSRAAFSLAAGADATIIESFDGAGAFFSNSVTEYLLGASARLARVVVEDAGEEGVVAALATLALAKGAAFDQTLLSFGGKLTRSETRIVHEGEGSRATLNSAIVATGARHADVTTLVTHQGQGCESRQTHRSALKDKSRGVFQGKFLVARGARKTDAEMNVGALLLSGLAEANHKPELEIYEADVKCSHGSTVGALDAEAIFYLRQRGLDEAAARALLIEAFLGAAFDGIAHPGIAHALRERIVRWLEAS